ncbi:MAG TPA: hypothetical protein VGP55_06275 [Chitinophagaceae bacterium]|nr:hypothetical protein [Chitinophagaceae bacterium]
MEAGRSFFQEMVCVLNVNKEDGKFFVFAGLQVPNILWNTM